MYDYDPVILSRIQFAFNISFHILFPSISIGLSWILLFFRLRFTQTRNIEWEHAYYFWVKVFALTFAIGIVSGVTMSFQFGTNWPGFMEKAGNIAGPLLGYEILTAFFLESSFLAIMLFGKNKVSNRVHLISTAIVALGTSVSAFWILSLSSWMQTPDGYILKDDVIHIKDWNQIIFNPSFPYKLTHMLIASMLTTSFLIAGVSVWKARASVDQHSALKVMKTGIILAAILTPMQILVGDLHGLNTLKHQPAKIAAIEAIWHTEKSVPLTLFGFPDEEKQFTDYAIKIPKLASWILTHDANSELKGLNEFKNEHPPVAPVFWSFRIMVGMGILMLTVSWLCALTVLRNKNLSRLQYNLLSAMTFSGWIAVLAGWYVTEIGRQPYIVYGLLKTSDVVADHAAGTVMTTLIAYAVVYTLILVFYIATLRYMANKPTCTQTHAEKNQN